MGRAWVWAVALALLGSPSSAVANERVEHEMLTVGPEVIDFGAGDACAFAVRVETTAYVNLKLFLEQGEPVREVARIEEVTRVVNVETGYALDERLHYSHRLDHVTGDHVDTGNVWHVRDAEGKLVKVGAGRVVLDLTGTVVEATPNTALAVGLPPIVSVIQGYCELLAAPGAEE